MKTATTFIFEIWDHIATYLSRDDLTRLAILSDFHLQVSRWHLYRNVILRNERQAIPSALDTIYLILRNPLLQRRIRSFTILTPSAGMSGPTEFKIKNWVERFGVQVFSTLTELRSLCIKRPPYSRVRMMERFMGVVGERCRKLVSLTMDGPSSTHYRAVGSKYTFATLLYQIPSLRSIVINGRNSNLGWNIASGVLQHPISNVTSLHIEISLPEQRWLADPADFADIWSLRFPHLQNLTIGEMPQGAHTATLSIFLNRHPTITHLALTARNADRTFSITPEPDALPNLRHLAVSPDMMHWLQVNVTLRSLRGIRSLVLDCSSTGTGAVSVFHHFPFYPQFVHLRHFTLLGIPHVSVTKSLMMTFAGLAPKLEHWTGGFYHRHNLGDMLELVSTLSSNPHLRRLDICQWIGAGCGIDEGSIGPFGAIFGPLKILEKMTIFATHMHMKTHEVVQEFRMKQVSESRDVGVIQGASSNNLGAWDGTRKKNELEGVLVVRGLVETYALNETKYGYRARRVLDFASTEWEYDEEMEAH